MNDDPVNASQLCQMMLEQIRSLLPEDQVYVCLVVENPGGIQVRMRQYDTVSIEKQDRKRKGPLIKAIRPGVIVKSY